jgi:hypothetical protein
MSYYHREENVFSDDFRKIESDLKNNDNGYNVIYRNVPNKDGFIRTKKIPLYTSGGVGSNIRDAETGDYYTNKVGSRDEFAFYKVILATGECRSNNGSCTLFFRSPSHFMAYLHCDVHQKHVQRWTDTRDALMNGIKINRNKCAAIAVRKN